MRAFYRTHETYMGDFLEVDSYPVFQPVSLSTGKARRRGRCRPTSEAQALLNRRRAETKFRRLVNANFGAGDYGVDITFRKGAQPENDEEAKRMIGNYMDRLRRKYKRAGIEMRYVLIAARGERCGRYHYHLFITGGIPRDVIEDAWGFGRVNCRRLQVDEDDGISGIAEYFLKQAEVFGRRWVGSRNLIQPQERVDDYKMSRSDARECLRSFGAAAEVVERLYPGWELCAIPRSLSNEINGGAYITLRLRRRREGEPEPWKRARRMKKIL